MILFIGITLRIWFHVNLQPSQLVANDQLKSDDLYQYKARFIGLDNQQEYGVNYVETFAPVAKMTIVRVILAIEHLDLNLLSIMDVKNALLHGDLKEEV